jgi:hypothetical protein
MVTFAGQRPAVGGSCILRASPVLDLMVLKQVRHPAARAEPQGTPPSWLQDLKGTAMRGASGGEERLFTSKVVPQP